MKIEFELQLNRNAAQEKNFTNAKHCSNEIETLFKRTQSHITNIALEAAINQELCKPFNFSLMRFQFTQNRITIFPAGASSKYGHQMLYIILSIISIAPLMAIERLNNMPLTKVARIPSTRVRIELFESGYLHMVRSSWRIRYC